VNIANIPAGTYVVAVSGGVDSVVLLRLLADMPHLKLVVAHFDHGMRPNSREDALFVQKLAKTYGLPCVTERIELGENASEATARRVRYNFLRRVQKKVSATAIITAHHQDDLLETAIINLMRGTGWRGLCSLRDTSTIRRPLLGTNKMAILKYAQEQGLEWYEDITNNDTRHLRNAIRHEVLPTAGAAFRQEMLALIARQGEIRAEVDESFADATRSPNPSVTPSRCSEVTSVLVDQLLCSAVVGWGEFLKIVSLTSALSLGSTAIGPPTLRSPLERSEAVASKFGDRVASENDSRGGASEAESLAEIGSQVASEGEKRGTRDDSSVTISRSCLIILPKLVSKELLSNTVHHFTGGRVEQRMLHRMWLFAKTARPAKTLQISRDLAMTVQKSTVVVHRR
jgi:tRNA(Ile)-lysidine synthase